VVRKGDDLFYGLYADSWSKNEAIQLRGLEKDIVYSIFDYFNNRPLGRVEGNNPLLKVDFTNNLLIRVRPERTQTSQ
jgi:alpha-galactosidase